MELKWPSVNYNNGLIDNFEIQRFNEEIALNKIACNQHSFPLQSKSYTNARAIVAAFLVSSYYYS